VVDRGGFEQVVALIKGAGGCEVLRDGYGQAVGADAFALFDQERPDSFPAMPGINDRVVDAALCGIDDDVANGDCIDGRDPNRHRRGEARLKAFAPLVDGVNVPRWRVLFVPGLVPEVGEGDEVAGLVRADRARLFSVVHLWVSLEGWGLSSMKLA